MIPSSGCMPQINPRYAIWGIAAVLCCWPVEAIAQMVPDRTLPHNSSVAVEGNIFHIQNGTRAGNNLFHSFQKFNVPPEAIAAFENAPEIRNIFTRITGNTPSQIDGTLQNNGTANLFLINPNGIAFGENARLDIGGSFLASTAASITFADKTQFSTTVSSPSSLLSISVPTGLQYGSQAGNITNASQTGLQVPQQQSLILAGSNLVSNGGHLQAPQGRIELAAVGNNARVNLQSVSSGWHLTYENVPEFGQLLYSQQSVADASGAGGGTIFLRGGDVTLTEGSSLVADTLANGTGGGIFIDANHLQVREGAFLSASTLGTGTGGDIVLNATDRIDIAGTGDFQEIGLKLFRQQFTRDDIRDGVFTTSFAAGKAGDIRLQSENIKVSNGSWVSASTFATGEGGSLQVRATDSVEVVQSSILTGTSGSRRSGNLEISASTLRILDGGVVTTITLGEGDGGNIIVDAWESIDIIARNKIEMVNYSPVFSVSFGLSTLLAVTVSSGNAGDLSISTKNLSLYNGGQILAEARGSGNGGDIDIDATEMVVRGTAINMNDDPIKNQWEAPSIVSVESLTSGNAGNLTIDTESLILEEGASIRARTTDTGNGGTLEVRASEFIDISGFASDGFSYSGLFAGASVSRSSTTAPKGNAGSVFVETPSLRLRDGGRISVVSVGLGDAGDVEIYADGVRLDGGIIKARTQVGASGNISVRSHQIYLQGNSRLNTDSQATTGGNIFLDTDVLVAKENSDITANAVAGFGGRVEVNAEGIFGTQFRQQTTPNSDITATSERGPAFSGTVEINTPDLNLAESMFVTTIEPLPTLPQSPCAIAGQDTGFIYTRRGGMPPTPRERVNQDATPSESPQRIVEAQGWVKSADGTIRLTADTHRVIPYGTWLKPPPACGIDESLSPSDRSW